MSDRAHGNLRHSPAVLIEKQPNSKADSAGVEAIRLFEQDQVAVSGRVVVVVAEEGVRGVGGSDAEHGYGVIKITRCLEDNRKNSTRTLLPRSLRQSRAGDSVHLKGAEPAEASGCH